MYLQFIPCLTPLGAERFEAAHCLTPELYERFLVTLFGLWQSDFSRGQYISIRFFDNLARIAAGYPPEQCGTLGFCTGQFVVEADGSVFPCDFYCVDNWKIGSILNSSFYELYNAPNMQKFRESSHYASSTENKCRDCKVYYLCRGGCRRDRDNSIDGVAGDNVYCGALYNFYCYAEPYLKEIAGQARNDGFGG